LSIIYFYVEQRNHTRRYADAPKISFARQVDLVTNEQTNLQCAHGTQRILLFETLRVQKTLTDNCLGYNTPWAHSRGSCRYFVYSMHIATTFPAASTKSLIAFIFVEVSSWRKRTTLFHHRYFILRFTAKETFFF
jgi:hypothetical protein